MCHHRRFCHVAKPSHRFHIFQELLVVQGPHKCKNRMIEFLTRQLLETQCAQALLHHQHRVIQLTIVKFQRQYTSLRLHQH